MRDHGSLFDQDTFESNVDAHFKSVGAGMLLGVVGAGVAAYIAFTTAPPVGGDLWPYIQFGVAVVASMIGFPVGAIVGYVSGFIATKITKRVV